MPISIYKRPFEFSWAGNPVVYQLYSSVGYYAPATTKIEVKLWYKWVNDIDWTEITTLSYYTVAGIANINLGPLLDSVLQYELPGYDSGNERKCWFARKQSCQYYIQHREITAATPNPAWENAELRFALKGGIDFMRWRGNNFFAEYMAAAEKPLLTWMPRSRQAAYNERMYLMYLHLTDEPAHAVQMSYTLVNGITGAESENIYLLPIPKGALFFIPAGAAQWDIDNINPGEPPVHEWEIEVTEGVSNDPVSEAFTFTRDNRQDYNQVNLTYRNSLGGVDSVMARGVIETVTEVPYETIDRVTEYNYYSGTAITPQRIVNNPGENAVYRGDVGWVPKDWQDRLRDMHVRRELYVFFDGKWWPMLDVTDNYKLRSSEDQIFSMPVTWKNAAPPQPYYTPADVDLGNATSESNICYAGILNLDIDVDTSGATAEIEVNLNVDDIRGVGVDKIEYRIPGEVDVWTTVLLTAVPFTVTGIPKNSTYQLLVRPVCPDNIPGNTTIGGFNTIGAGSGTGDASSFKNNTGVSVTLQLLVNNNVIISGQVIANGATHNFALADTYDADVYFNLVGLPGITTVVAASNAVPYNSWVISGNQAEHQDIDIVGGIQITVT